MIECMCAQTRPRFILSSDIVLGNGVKTNVNSKGKIPSDSEVGSESNPRRYIKQDSEPNTLPTELCQPTNSCMFCVACLCFTPILHISCLGHSTELSVPSKAIVELSAKH